jgi:hypothetical protein
MKVFLWALTVCGSVLGGIISVAGVLAAKGAPQEAAAAAIGVACAVIPYCLARAASEISDSSTSAAVIATMAENLIAIRNNTSPASVKATENTRNGTPSAKQPDDSILPRIRT